MDPKRTKVLAAPPVQPLQVLDIEAYEKLMGLLESGEDLPALLGRKTAGEFRERDLAVWLHEDSAAPSDTPRMRLLDEWWEKMSEEVVQTSRLVEESQRRE